VPDALRSIKTFWLWLILLFNTHHLPFFISTSTYLVFLRVYKHGGRSRLCYHQLLPDQEVSLSHRVAFSVMSWPCVGACSVLDRGSSFLALSPPRVLRRRVISTRVLTPPISLCYPSTAHRRVVDCILMSSQSPYSYLLSVRR
jgi:hypothetical protein